MSWDQAANENRRMDRNRGYDGSFSGRRMSFVGLPEPERTQIHGAIMDGDVRILVQDGFPTCPEGEALLRERNARWNRQRR